MVSGEIHITEHAFLRSKQRLGWNRNTTIRMVEKAASDGLTHAETTGRLNRYISKQYLLERKADNIRIYGEHIFMISGNTLITILRLPNEFKKIVHSKGKHHHATD